MSGRDKLGRFAPGNQIAVGNKGNRNPKWGNKNALKHGFYEKFNVWYVGTDGWLVISVLRGEPARIRIHPDDFYMDEAGLHIRLDILEELRR